MTTKPTATVTSLSRNDISLVTWFQIQCIGDIQGWQTDAIRIHFDYLVLYTVSYKGFHWLKTKQLVGQEKLLRSRSTVSQYKLNNLYSAEIFLEPQVAWTFVNMNNRGPKNNNTGNNCGTDKHDRVKPWVSPSCLVLRLLSRSVTHNTIEMWTVNTQWRMA